MDIRRMHVGQHVRFTNETPNERFWGRSGVVISIEDHSVRIKMDGGAPWDIATATDRAGTYDLYYLQYGEAVIHEDPF